MTDTQLIKKYFDEFAQQLTEQHETRIQQQSASNSGLVRDIEALKIQMQKVAFQVDKLETRLGNYQFGGKLILGTFIALGAIITWIVNSTGWHVNIMK